MAAEDLPVAAEAFAAAALAVAVLAAEAFAVAVLAAEAFAVAVLAAAALVAAAFARGGLVAAAFARGGLVGGGEEDSYKFSLAPCPFHAPLFVLGVRPSIKKEGLLDPMA